jgi:putative ABC transport system permease protein
MEALLKDVRYAFRDLLKRPGFTAIVVITLALGIGANTAIFSVINAVLLNSLPYKEPGRIAMLWGKNPQLHLNMTEFPIAYSDFIDLRAQSQSFESLSALYPNSVNLAGDAAPEHVGGANVSANFFQMLGIAPALGRSFLSDEEQLGKDKVVILSNDLWQRRFGSDPGLVGKTIRLDGESNTVVGIMPAVFEFPQRNDMLLSYGFPRQVEVWKPITPEIQELKSRGNHVLIVMGRLKAGITLPQAQSEVSSLATNLARQNPNFLFPDWNVALVPLQEQVIGKIRPALMVLFGAVGFVLLIACANVANLMLARAATRQKEIAIRSALGASSFRLIRQLLTESVMLSLAGGLAGLLLALWCMAVIPSLMPASIPRIGKIGLDSRVLGFTVVVSLLTGIVFGLLPALQSAKPNLNEVLKEGGRSATESRHRTRSLFVISEIALTFVLLIGAGLLVKSFLRLQQVDPGFDPKNVLAMQIDLPQSKYPESRQWSEFFNQLTEKVKALPGVKSVGWTWQVPLGGSDASTGFIIEGRSTDSEQAPLAGSRRVDSGYFRTIGTPILQGREFTEQDKQNPSRPIIINETMARRFWRDESPLGKRIKVLGASREIVGIAKDMKYSAIDSETVPEMYFQSNLRFMNLLVRTESDPLQMVSAIRREVEAIDKDQPISEVTTLEQRVSNSVAARRFNMLLTTVFAGVALALALIGLYGVMSYTVTQSTREIGIRMALGAQSGSVLKLMVSQGFVLTVIGMAIGLGACMGLTRLMKALLFGVSPTDTLTFVSVGSLLAFVALAACYFPARRATKIDPLVALRYE